MFHHYEDHRFKKIIDEFILSATANDEPFSCAIRNIDLQAAKLGLSFYHMMFILIQKDSNEKNRRKKKWLINIYDKLITAVTFSK
jgi:hypothetical protein